MSVAGIHAYRAAKRIARELVEQQDQRECAARRLLPAIELAATGRFIAVQKRVAEAAVECIILGKPARRARFAPEGDDVGRPAWHGGGFTNYRNPAGMGCQFDKSFAA